MAQYDIVFAVNEASSGELFSEQKIRLSKGQILAGTNTFPVAVGPLLKDYLIIGDPNQPAGLDFIEIGDLGSMIPQTQVTFSGDVSNINGTWPNYNLIVVTGAISSGKLASNAVTTAKISNANVTYAKIQNVTANRLLGRVTSNGSVQEISLGNGLSFNGSTLEATGTGSSIEIVTVTNSNRTLILSDAGKYVRMDSSVQRSVTIPPNSSVNFPVGTVITIEQSGQGSVEIVPGSGVALNAFQDGDGPPGRYASVQIIQVAANNWTLIGAIQI